jgi:hypothetical protein
VHVDGELTYEKWWDNFRQGRCFVTNGPLLRCRANGSLPGEIFRGAAGDEIHFDVTVDLASRDPIRAVEIIKGGQVDRAVPFDEAVRTRNLGQITFRESGWFAVRAIAENADTFRFAHSAPFYVQIGDDGPRVSKTSAEFFRAWLSERSKQFEQIANLQQRRELLDLARHAQEFWLDRAARANAP